jgi:hypothetical protein
MKKGRAFHRVESLVVHELPDASHPSVAACARGGSPLEAVMTKGRAFHRVSSLDEPASAFQSYIRQHWSIENSCHWVLDNTFRYTHFAKITTT